MAARSAFTFWNGASNINRFFWTNITPHKITKCHFSCNFLSTQIFTRNVRCRSSGFNVVASVCLESRNSIHSSIKKSQSKAFRTNENIKAKYVRLIDQEGKNHGVMSLKSALEIGRNLNYLVLEVSSSESETVCKLINEQQLYTKMKEEKKKHVKTTKTKEIKLTGKITDHDLEIKLKKIREFLESHNSVKVFVAHRRRQNVSMDDKQAVINNIAGKISDLGVLQGEPRTVGKGLRSMFVPHPQK